MANWLVLFVQSRMQKFADSEVGDDLGRDFDCGAGSWVPSGARLAMLDRERAEATYLDPTAPRKCFTEST